MFDQSHDQPADLMVEMRDARIISDLSLAYKIGIDRTCL